MSVRSDCSVSCRFLADGEEVKVSFTDATRTSQKMAIAALSAVEGPQRLRFILPLAVVTSSIWSSAKPD